MNRCHAVHSLSNLRRWMILAGLAIASLTLCNSVCGQRINFELATENGFPIGGQQKWIELFTGMDQTSIRIRQARPGDQERVENRGTEDAPRYEVLGILTSRNRLRVPGGEFSLSDRQRLSSWIEKVTKDGVEGPTAERHAFGLTAEQLVGFHERLAAPVPEPTKSRRIGDVARQIVRLTSMEFHVSDTAKASFTSAELCPDELQGLSAGTALAAAIRPLGLVFLPERDEAKTHLAIMDVRETKEAWPVGWPPQEIPGKVYPKLFDYLTVEIKDKSVQEALEAVDGRLDIPFVFDRNDMARKRIDLNAFKVTIPRDRVSYKRLLDKVLFYGKMTNELRVDEAGTPFLWISPL